MVSESLSSLVTKSNALFVPLPRQTNVYVYVSEQAVQLQQTVQELQKALEITRRARKEDQVALQQEVEERDGVIQSFSSENQQLHRLLQVTHTQTRKRK